MLITADCCWSHVFATAERDVNRLRWASKSISSDPSRSITVIDQTAAIVLCMLNALQENAQDTHHAGYSRSCHLPWINELKPRIICLAIHRSIQHLNHDIMSTLIPFQPSPGTEAQFPPNRRNSCAEVSIKASLALPERLFIMTNFQNFQLHSITY